MHYLSLTSAQQELVMTQLWVSAVSGRKPDMDKAGGGGVFEFEELCGEIPHCFFRPVKSQEQPYVLMETLLWETVK